MRESRVSGLTRVGEGVLQDLNSKGLRRFFSRCLIVFLLRVQGLRIAVGFAIRACIRGSTGRRWGPSWYLV